MRRSEQALVGAPRVAVVGAGIMGRGIAEAFAIAGVDASICDRSVEISRQALDLISTSIGELAALGRLGPTECDEVMGRVTVCEDIGSALADATMIVEAVPEDMAVKEAVWTEISLAAPTTAAMASNTSSFDIDLLAAFVADPARLLGTHWYNPAYLVPCVEVVCGSETSPAVCDAVVTLLTQVGKAPVEVANRAGFVGNRLQFAMIAEAFRCLEEGIASASDIDLVVRSSFGPRLAGFGPFELADLGGLDTYAAILRYLSDSLGDRFEPPRLLEQLVEQGRWGVKRLAGVFDYDPEEAAERIAARDQFLLAQFGT